MLRVSSPVKNTEDFELEDETEGRGSFRSNTRDYVQESKPEPVPVSSSADEDDEALSYFARLAEE